MLGAFGSTVFTASEYLDRKAITRAADAVHRIDFVPKIVDHDQRRAELVGAALSLISRLGVAGVTTRAVSEEAGWSTGVLAHYFRSREDLLAGALAAAADEQAEIYNRVLGEYRDSPVDTLVAIVDSVLPLDDRRITMTRIFLFFYAQAATDDMARRSIDGYLTRWREIVRVLIDDIRHAGLVPESVDAAAEARYLVSVTDGVAMHRLLLGYAEDADAAKIVRRWRTSVSSQFL